MTEFFRVVTPGEIFEMFPSFDRLMSERVELEESLGRVLAEAIVATEDLPAAPRAIMDGYAVRAQDTFGATESLPGMLSVIGCVEMGKIPEVEIGTGQAVEIPTGGFLPAGADSVLMLEYANPTGEGSIEISRSVTKGENVLGRGEDVAVGEVLVKPGRRVRPQDVGIMAGLGKIQVCVSRRPRVALVSTGNEIVPIRQNPVLGQIRDTNTYSVSALARSTGADVLSLGIIPDDVALLEEAILKGLSECDVVVVSGGSSVGTRDLMAGVVAHLPEARVLAHGVAISPGKPTLLASAKGKALFVLPGHPVSAMIIAEVFLLAFLRYLEGEAPTPGLAGRTVEAVLATSIPSVQGREEYVRVRLEFKEGRRYAQPVFGRSSMLSTMVRSDGLVRVPIHAEGIAGGENVEVILF